MSLFWAAPAFAGKVTLYTDDSRTAKIKREKLDCHLHRTKGNSLTLGFKVGVPFAVKAGPEVSFGKKAEVSWNSMSQRLILLYEELCEQHNKAHVTVAEFDRRMADLREHFKKAADLRDDIESAMQSREDKMFAEMEREEAKHAGGSESREDKLRRLSQEVERLSRAAAGEAAEKP